MLPEVSSDPHASAAPRGPARGIRCGERGCLRDARRFRRDGRGSSRRAFTLIEVLIVVVILSIVAALAVPRVITAMTDSRLEAAQARGRQLLTLVVRYNQFFPATAIPVVDGPIAPAELGKLVTVGYCVADDLINPVDAAKGWSFAGPNLVPTP